jgi:hypothetical protein
MMQQQQSVIGVNTTGSSVSNSSQDLNSGGGTHSTYVPPMLTVLHTRKPLFECLLQEHYPDFQQWYKQRLQAVEEQG